MAGGSILFVLAFFRLPVVVTILVLSAFASRVSLDVAGLHTRPEHLASIVLLLAILIRGRGGDFLRQGFRAPSVYLFLYVVYSTFISILFSESFFQSASVLSWLFLDWVLLTSLLAANPSRNVIYNALAWGSGLAATLALVEWVAFATTGQSFGVQRSLGELSPAAFGLSYEANILAGALVLSALALFSAPPQYIRRWHTLAGVLALAALPVTQTRAAVLGVAVGFIVLLVFSRDRISRRRVRRTMAAAAGIAVVILMANWQTWNLLGKFVGIVDFSSGTGAYRLNIQRMALNDMQGMRSWVFGLGSNSFSQRHLDPSRPGQGIEAYLANLPLQIIYDTGIIGLCLILLLIAALLHRSRFSGSSLALMAAFAIVASATSPFWFATTWIFVALAVLPRDPDPVAPSRDRAKESAGEESVVWLSAR
jgi:O-antigen ligase